MDVFEVVKVTVRTFDQKTIALGSSRFYKSSNHLLVNSKQNAKVPREGTYDAEMYRILTNWLTKVHGYEITGQWHLDGICDDVIEILASGSVPKIKKHFDHVSKYVNQLCPEEVWIVHFSREDSIVIRRKVKCHALLA
ncbi:P-loop containing nucleoside triphosphate hydrolase protein [Gigaspora margarita]|uniref:P-loop containing nucleoside triphosphate hydrolase protein n=1 Tax=Gigaspora margarita TaxID=4874 RepID=A0A8H3X6W2_GIGMA|nr:P-loop containing nucleoside triphosphate hydrolase protein [Gigaspora margarita]